MTLNSALIASRAGLDATQIWSEITARNIANANTPGYIRKEAVMTTRSEGAGGTVDVTEIRREVNASLDRMYRGQTSQMAKQQTIYQAVNAYTVTLGQPQDGFSPAARLTALQNSFQTLANSPSSSAAQRGALDAANLMVKSLNDTNSALGQIKGEVASEIGYDVTDVNRMLHKIADLNTALTGAQANSVAGADIRDQIGQLSQDLSAKLDVQVALGSDGRASIYTGGGTLLLDGNTVQDLSYNPASGKLFAGQTEITPGATGVRGFDNGSLGGLFQLKDQTLPQFQLQLDEMARSLIENFQAKDASLSPGQPGLFTDAGAAYNAANLNGLAGRIAVNAAVDPSRGGVLTRMRDGVGATSPGQPGDATQVNAFLSIFTSQQSFAAGTGLGTSQTLGDYAANMVAAQHVVGTQAQTDYDALKTSADTTQSTRTSIEGVNLDNELQKLIVIQHSYAANSKVMGVVGQMMDSLLQAV